MKKFQLYDIVNNSYEGMLIDYWENNLDDLESFCDTQNASFAYTGKMEIQRNVEHPRGIIGFINDDVSRVLDVLNSRFDELEYPLKVRTDHVSDVANLSDFRISYNISGVINTKPLGRNTIFDHISDILKDMQLYTPIPDLIKFNKIVDFLKKDIHKGDTKYDNWIPVKPVSKVDTLNRRVLTLPNLRIARLQRGGEQQSIQVDINEFKIHELEILNNTRGSGTKKQVREELVELMKFMSVPLIAHLRANTGNRFIEILGMDTSERFAENVEKAQGITTRVRFKGCDYLIIKNKNGKYSAMNLENPAEILGPELIKNIIAKDSLQRRVLGLQ